MWSNKIHLHLKMWLFDVLFLLLCDKPLQEFFNKNKLHNLYDNISFLLSSNHSFLTNKKSIKIRIKPIQNTIFPHQWMIFMSCFKMITLFAFPIFWCATSSQISNNKRPKTRKWWHIIDFTLNITSHHQLLLLSFASIIKSGGRKYLLWFDFFCFTLCRILTD